MIAPTKFTRLRDSALNRVPLLLDTLEEQIPLPDLYRETSQYLTASMSSC